MEELAVPDRNQKILALSAPLAFVICGFINEYLAFMVPVMVYVYARWAGAQFVRLHALRLIDFFLSLLIYGLLLGLLYGAIEMVEKDAGGDSIFMLANEAMLVAGLIASVILVLVSFVIATIKAGLGRDFRYPLSIRIFETLGRIGSRA